MSGKLLAHTDTSVVTEAIVRAEPRPKFTKTWRPYSHGEVLDAIQAACDTLDWEVTDKKFSIRPNAKMFSVWNLKKMAGNLVNGKESTLSVGIRNSINKTFSIGVCAGINVFVCDNLVFRGDFVLFRKHTGQLGEEELFIMAEEALRALSSKFEEVQTWHNDLKTTELSAQQATTLAVAAMARKYPLIPPAKYNEFHELYFDDGSKYTPTLHGFHGAITEMWHKTHLVDYMWRTGLLVDFLDHEAPLVLGMEKSGTTWQPGRIPFFALQDEAKDLKKIAKDAEFESNKELAVEMKSAVKERLKANGKKEKEPAKPKKKPAKKTAQKAPQKPTTEKKVRKTVKAKVREQVAAKSAVKGKPARKVKPEKTKTAKRKKTTFEDSEDVYFCADCQEEFQKKDVRKVGADLVCDRCREGRREAKEVIKKKKK